MNTSSKYIDEGRLFKNLQYSFSVCMWNFNSDPRGLHLTCCNLDTNVTIAKLLSCPSWNGFLQSEFLHSVEKIFILSCFVWHLKNKYNSLPECRDICIRFFKNAYSEVQIVPSGIDRLYGLLSFSHAQYATPPFV